MSVRHYRLVRREDWPPWQAAMGRVLDQVREVASMSIEVIKPGTRVTLGDDVDAVINEAIVGVSGQVSYYVVYWSGGERKLVRVEAHEVTASTAERLPIGYAEAFAKVIGDMNHRTREAERKG